MRISLNFNFISISFCLRECENVPARFPTNYLPIIAIYYLPIIATYCLSIFAIYYLSFISKSATTTSSLLRFSVRTSENDCHFRPLSIINDKYKSFTIFIQRTTFNKITPTIKTSNFKNPSHYSSWFQERSVCLVFLSFKLNAIISLTVFPLRRR